MNLSPSDFTEEQVTPGLESFVKGFLQDRKSELVELRRFFAEGNLEGLEKTGHQWKGFSEPYGFKQLGIWGAELQRAAQEGQRETCLELLDKIEAYIQIKEKTAES